MRFFLPFLLLFVSVQQTHLLASPQDLYEAGVAKRDSGDWQEALRLWQLAKDSLAHKQLSDPRIGLAFIELATARQITEFYPQASQMYFWGFTDYDLKKRKSVLAAEVERLAPIMTRDESESWSGLLKSSDMRLNNLLKGFWVARDPIPTTPVNERLIEHWERIAYVRSNFTLANTSAYGSDDRGLVFVKYGAADATYGGKLGTDLLEIMRWFEDFQIRQEVQRFNTLPECEIWVYRRMREDESAVFLFGKDGGYGKYGLRTGIEDFIPDRAFSRSSTQMTRGVLPGAVLQLMFYRQLIDVDRFYFERYKELETLWVNSRAAGRLSPDYDFYKGKLNNFRSLDRDMADFRYLPIDRSDALEGLDALRIKYRTFRYFDPPGESQLMLVVLSADLPEDLAFNRFFDVAKKSMYKNRHLLIPYDSNWRPLNPMVDYPALRNTNTSVFFLPGRPELAYTLVAEKTLLDFRAVELEQEDIPDTARVLGIGSVFLGKIPALSEAPDRLEVSDLLLGFPRDTGEASTQDLPFPVVPQAPFRQSDTLFVYLEVYNLTLDDKSSGEIEIEYAVRKVKNDGKIDKKGQISNKQKQNPNSTRYSHTISFDLRELQSGEFELEVKLKDRKAKQEKVRRARFTVVEG